MRLTFEHLLGLPAEAALAVLHASGIMDVEVVPTAAPPRRHPVSEDQYRTEEGEAAGYASTRVVAVEEDGRRLIVSRFFSSCQTNCSKYSPLVRRRDAARSSAWRYASRSICTQTLTLSGAHRPKGSSSPWGSVKSLLFMGAPSAASYAADGGGFHGAVFPGEGCIIRKKSKQACFFWEKRACLL